MTELISREDLMEALEKDKRFASKHSSFDYVAGLCAAQLTVGIAPTIEAVVLPCKLGTTLYRICEEGRGRKPFIREVTFNRTNFARIVLDNEVGRTVFLTREEAEAALVKMKDGDPDG